jgi:hypothetical protein
MGKERMKWQAHCWRWKHADKDWLCSIFSAVEFTMFIGSKTKLEWFPQAGMVRVKLKRDLLEESGVESIVLESKDGEFV